MNARIDAIFAAPYNEDFNLELSESPAKVVVAPPLPARLAGRKRSPGEIKIQL
jgi:hypothetical protein